MFKKLIYPILMFMALPLIGFSQVAEDGWIPATEKRPKYAPWKEKHRNVRDQYDRKQGLWKFYSYTHDIIAEVEYLNDRKHGVSKRYYAHSGTIMEIAQYFDGRKDGDYESYYYNGQMKMEGNYIYGRRHGMWTYYYLTTGEKRSEGQYHNGKRHGQWKFYNSKGQLSKTLTYENGEITMQNGVRVETKSKTSDDSEKTEQQILREKFLKQQRLRGGSSPKEEPKSLKPKIN